MWCEAVGERQNECLPRWVQLPELPDLEGEDFSGQGQGQVEFQGQEVAGGGQEREGEEVGDQEHIMG